MLEEDDKQFAYAFLADRESYHSQKENSAHAIFLIEAGLFGALWTTNALAGFMKAVNNPQLIVPAIIIFIWCLFHVLLRWQLRNRRIASLQVSTLLSAITDHLAKRPEPDLVVSNLGGKLSTFLDHFVPRPRSTFVDDVKLQRFPEWYRLRYLALQNEKKEASFGEIFPTYGSIVMVVATVAYVFLK